MEQTLIGSVVDGRYLVTARLARGGMAVVYRARDKRLERDVAIKLMHPHLAEQPNFTERFNREARAAARLSNPHVVAVYDQGVWDSQAYLAMEFIPGPDVRSELTRLGSFTLGTALSITEQTLAALAAAHKAGLIHRDVKPENIMLEESIPPQSVFDHPAIVAKVTDFGLARAVTASTTTSSTAMGTVAYIAPEIITDGSADARSDLYSVGIMLYEFLTGSLPFHADAPIRAAYMHVHNPLPRAADQAPWLPAAIDSFIGALTAKNRDDRPADGQAALTQLRALLPLIAPEALIRRVPVIGRTLDRSATLTDESAQPQLTPQSASPSSHTVRLPETAPSPASGPATPAPATAEAPSSSAFPSSPPGTTVLTRTAHEDAQRRDTEKVPRGKRWWILLLVVLLIASAGAGAWYFLAGPGQRATVPDITGETTAAAYDLLEGEGFIVKESRQYSDDIPADHVISSDPNAGARVHPDTTVTIAISQGIEQVSVPDTRGRSLEEATTLAKASRLEVASVQAYSEEVAEGNVISQDVEPGTTVDHSSTLTLTVSKGRQPIDVPTVAGESKHDAVAALESAGLKADVKDAYSDSVHKGTVISQSPEGGTLFRNDSVTITVSKGPELVEVPNVTFSSKDEAVSTLEAAGFTVKIEELYGGVFGVVRFQDPEGGTMAAPGTAITISIM